MFKTALGILPLVVVLGCSNSDLQGPIGPVGPKGADGEIGAVGPVGPIGPMGLEGAMGPKGDKGDKGDVLVIDGGSIVGPKGDTGTVTVINVVDGGSLTVDGGIVIAAGPVGPQGPVGVAGPVGPAGPMGLPGAAGPAGQQGATGNTGPAGATGLQGSTGLQGNTGSQGPQGPRGPSTFFGSLSTASCDLASAQAEPCNQSVLVRRSTVFADNSVSGRTVVCRATGRAHIDTSGGLSNCSSGSYSVSVSLVGPSSSSPTVTVSAPPSPGLQPNLSYDVPYVIEWAFPQATTVTASYSLAMSQNLTPYSGGTISCTPQGSYAIAHIVGFSCQSVSDE